LVRDHLHLFGIRASKTKTEDVLLGCCTQADQLVILGASVAELAIQQIPADSVRDNYQLYLVQGPALEWIFASPSRQGQFSN